MSSSLMAKESMMSDRSLIPADGVEGIPASESLPAFVARRWGFSLQSHEKDGATLYSIRDWISGLTNSEADKARDIWKRFRYREGEAEGGVVSSPGPYVAQDNRTYVSDFTNDEGLYRVAMSLRVSKNRPALRPIKDYLARAGVFVDEARRDPERASEQLAITRRNQALASGKSEEWVSAREESVVTRKQFVANIYALVKNKQSFRPIIGAITDDVYRGVFEDDTAGLRTRLGITSKQNPRDHFSRIALAYTTIAEESVKIHLSRYNEHEYVPIPVIRTVVQTLSDAIGVQVSTLAKALQIDIVSGRKILDKPMTQGEFKSLLTKASQPRPTESDQVE